MAASRNQSGARAKQYLSRLARLINKPIYNLIYNFKPNLSNIVIGSGISPSYEKYAKTTSTIITIIMILTGILLPISLYRKLGVLAIILGFIVPISIILPIGIALTIQIPIIMYRNRGSILEAKFPLFIAILATLTSSGAPLYVVFKELEHRIDILKPFALEIGLLNSLISLGYKTDEALMRVARITPSKSLRETLISLRPVSRIGGNPYTVVSSVFRRYNDEYRLRVEGVVNTLGMLMEIFVASALLIPITLVTMAILVAIIPGSFSTQMLIMALILTTSVASVAILIISDTIVSRMRL